MADFEGQKPSGDSELENFLMIEKQKAQVNAQVRKQVFFLRPKFNNFFCLFSRFMNSMKFVGTNVLRNQDKNWIVNKKIVFIIVLIDL